VQGKSPNLKKCDQIRVAGSNHTVTDLIRFVQENAMILMSEELRAWGYTVTSHYTHPPRSVVMQVHLSGRADFTETTPGDPIFRGTAFFTSFIAAGVETDLMVAPHFGASQFRAVNLSEVRAELIAENCGVTAVATQFSVLAALPPGDSLDAAFQTRTVAFVNPANGTTRYQHIVKIFAGGRSVSEQEAVDTARRNAGRFSLDLAHLAMKITTDGAEAAP
jgi:hypothetical protein